MVAFPRGVPSLAVLAAGLLAGCRAAVPVAVAPEVVAGPARPAELPAAAEPQPAAGAVAASRVGLVRVLLHVADTVTLPEPGRRYLCRGDEGELVVRGPLRVELERGAPAVQVGAFASRSNAEALARRLHAAGIRSELRRTGAGLDAVVAVGDAGMSVHDLEGRVAALGIERVLRLPGDGRLTLAGEAGRVGTSQSFSLHPIDPVPVDTGTVRVRGGLVVRVDAKGVALINVLPIEEYLRGVVPAEMGPRAFPALEALKAQAVAARTYAVAHLGEFASLGYDICATTACQVYQGVGVEHPLTDRAVAETSGLVLTFEGRPIDAMYHSTCGGHTEDAAALLPERAAPYLRGVPCRGERLVRLGAGRGRWLGEGERLALVAARLAEVLGVEPEAGALARRLGAGGAGAGGAGVLGAFGLGGLASLVAVEGSGDDAATELLRLFRLALPPPGDNLSRRGWELALVVRVGQLAGMVEEREGRVVAGEEGTWFVPERGGERLPLGGGETVLVRQGSLAREGAVTTVSGSPASLWCVGGRCPVLEVVPLAAADGRSSWSSWVREIPVDEAAAKLGVTSLDQVVVTARGRSGRATAVELVAAGNRQTMAGFSFRLRLGLPDTLFAVVVRERDGGRVLRFFGRGWGHGIGLCQNGAYGLALGGAGFEEILKSYYTGVSVERWSGG